MGFFKNMTVKEIIDLKNELKTNKQKLKKIKPKLVNILTDKKSNFVEKRVALDLIEEFNVLSASGALFECFINKEEDVNLRLNSYRIFSKWLAEEKIKKPPRLLINCLFIDPNHYTKVFTALYLSAPNQFAKEVIKLADDDRIKREARLALLSVIERYVEKNIVTVSKRQITKKVHEMIRDLLRRLAKIRNNKEELFANPAAQTLLRIDEVKEEEEEFLEKGRILSKMLSLSELEEKEKEILLQFIDQVEDNGYQELATRLLLMSDLQEGSAIELALSLFWYFKSKKTQIEENLADIYDQEKKQKVLKMIISLGKYLHRNKIIPFEPRSESNLSGQQF